MTIKTWKQARQEYVLMGGDFYTFCEDHKIPAMQAEIDELRAALGVATCGALRVAEKQRDKEALDAALAAQREKLATHFEKHEFIQGKFVAKLIRESGE